MELFLSEILNFRNNNVDCYYHEIQKEEIFSNDQSMILEDLAHRSNLFLIKNFLKDNFIKQDHPKNIQKELSMELPEENFYENKSICSNLKFKDNQDGEIEDNIQELAKSVDILENYKNSLSRNSEKNGNDLSKKKDERKRAKYWILEFEKLFSIEELCKLLKEAFKGKPYHIVDEESSGEYIKILIEFENEEKIHVESKILRKVNLFPKNVITYSARKKELLKKLKNNLDKNKSHRNKLNIDWKYKKIKNILIKTNKYLDKSLIIISKDDID